METFLLTFINTLMKVKKFKLQRRKAMSNKLEKEVDDVSRQELIQLQNELSRVWMALNKKLGKSSMITRKLTTIKEKTDHLIELI